MQEKNKVHPKHKLFGGAPQVVCIKWECTGATTIFKRDYPIEYIIVDSKGRKNRQCNSVLIVQVKRAKERAETEAEVDSGQISLFGAFSQGSNASDAPPSPPPRRKSPRLKTPPPAAAEEEGEASAMMFALLQEQHKSQMDAMAASNQKAMEAIFERMNAIIASNGKVANKENKVW